MKVKVNKKNRTAHLEDCVSAMNLKEDNVFILPDAKAAKRMGFVFCKACQSRLDDKKLLNRIKNFILRRKMMRRNYDALAVYAGLAIFGMLMLAAVYKNEPNTEAKILPTITATYTQTITPKPSPQQTSTSVPTLKPKPTIPKPIVQVNTNIRKDILTYLENVAEENGYSLELLQGMIQYECEGTWDPNFIDNQDYGLCQINVCNHAMLRSVFKNKYPNFNILNYKTNIDSAVYILNMYKLELKNSLHRNPTEAELLTSYNRGTYYIIKRVSRGIDFNRGYYKQVELRKQQYERWNKYVKQSTKKGNGK